MTRFVVTQLAVSVNKMSIPIVLEGSIGPNGQTIGISKRPLYTVDPIGRPNTHCNGRVRTGIKVAKEDMDNRMGIKRLWTVVLEIAKGKR